MFYIEAAIRQGVWGVRDTKDGSLESYSEEELARFVSELKLNIVGVTTDIRGVTRFQRIMQDELVNPYLVQRLLEALKRGTKDDENAVINRLFVLANGQSFVLQTGTVTGDGGFKVSETYMVRKKATDVWRVGAKEKDFWGMVAALKRLVMNNVFKVI